MKILDTPKIKFLKPTFGNDVGDIVKVVIETEWHLYYYDSFHRYCYLDKEIDKDVYEYIPMKNDRVQ